MEPASYHDYGDHIIYFMYFHKKLDMYNRYPDQLLTALAKVGGLLGLLKLLSIFLTLYHQRLFEGEYQTKEIIKSESKANNINETGENEFLEENLAEEYHT